MGNLCRSQAESASDDQLMKAIVNRDSGALEAIYKRYESLVRTVILGVVRDESDVDDVLMDVLTQIW
jgi:DNA-directed RNA polymerase specialized sigma24 family protein